MKHIQLPFFFSSLTRPSTWLIGAACNLFTAASLHAATYPLPLPGDDLIGELRAVPALSEEDSLIDIAQRNGVGYDEIRAANLSVDSWLPHTGTLVVIPSSYILPPFPREGIIINTAEMRLYYYPKPAAGQAPVVETFPVSVGRGDWKTPIVTTKITRKMADPVWRPPKTIRAEHALDDDILPTIVPAGPDNPLGRYALYMSLPGYLLHGTNNENGVGMQVTHGCMRMYAPDIERLFRTVPVGTQVRIINQPYKAGWHNGALYLEAHPVLEGMSEKDSPSMRQVVTDALRNHADYAVDWTEAEVLHIEVNGLPKLIGPLPAIPVAPLDTPIPQS